MNDKKRTILQIDSILGLLLACSNLLLSLKKKA